MQKDKYINNNIIILFIKSSFIFTFGHVIEFYHLIIASLFSFFHFYFCNNVYFLLYIFYLGIFSSFIKNAITFMLFYISGLQLVFSHR